jgi:hypothetical protein
MEMSSFTTVRKSDACYDGLWLFGSHNSNMCLGLMNKHQMLKEYHGITVELDYNELVRTVIAQTV